MSILFKYFRIGNFSWLKTVSFSNYFYVFNNIEDIKFFLNNKPPYMNVYIIGGMSNTLFRNGGISYVLIRLGRGFNYIKKNKFSIIVGCSIFISKFYCFSLKYSIYGFQFLHGIPGTLGGMLAMNAGAYRYNICHYLISIKAINIITFELRSFFIDDIFCYRSNKLTVDWLFIEAIFFVRFSNRSIINLTCSNISTIRNISQPSYLITSGSTFKNLIVFSSWKLLIKSNIIYFYLGNGAMFSLLHANFIFNNYFANSLDLENLIVLSKYLILKKFNLNILLEIKIIGRYKLGL